MKESIRNNFRSSLATCGGCELSRAPFPSRRTLRLSLIFEKALAGPELDFAHSTRELLRQRGILFDSGTIVVRLAKQLEQHGRRAERDEVEWCAENT